MRTAKEKLESLQKNSVWVFTKQETNFEEAFNSARLFYEIPNKEDVRIEDYFHQNHALYNIQTNRHRILVIPQLFGLMTKTPFYTRGGRYNTENCTAVFEQMLSVASDPIAYNTLKTEQLLKMKIHAIVDTANNNSECNILPVVFIYKVLRGLKEKYSIDSVSINHLYTYIMTCTHYSEVDEAIEFIYQKAPATKYLEEFKSRSRVLTCIKNNINLFNITSDSISLNPNFDDYFFNNFIKKYDFEELHEQLSRNVDYSYFLYNIQGFGINLIDKPETSIDVTVEKISISPYIDDEDETAYINKVDSIKESNINEKAAVDAHTIEPVAVSRHDIGRRFRTNPLLGKIAIKKANYLCEKEVSHETFISKKSNKKYMEAHHLIPVCFQKEIWDKYGVNIDCVENLVSLCPTCHKAIHYGTKEVKEQMIKQLYKQCAPKYKTIGLSISLEEIKAFYKL